MNRHDYFFKGQTGLSSYRISELDELTLQIDAIRDFRVLINTYSMEFGGK
jgi:hypothetical protein